MIINFDLLPNLFLSAPQSGGLKTYRSWTGAAGRVVFVDCCCSLVFENARSKSKGQHFRVEISSRSVVLALQYAAKMAQADGAPSFAVERRDDDGRGSFSSMRG